eukprot:CAMPEP_0201635448 /NCGR_PEP_ID=MMETSP0493-20130528/7983_1 /ASSEMBLY_ACC=CAM_ASM_000838 /TAXON_ID=420259 /ORGANISM="Thalassiosira gravida, Strain GMp14c1" /LENGTH=143 /DNA_ID=CAMNT_0048107417 /DNA_START=1 /DNA_END=432 /DNA_ORIENTATION=+
MSIDQCSTENQTTSSQHQPQQQQRHPLQQRTLAQISSSSSSTTSSTTTTSSSPTHTTHNSNYRGLTIHSLSTSNPITEIAPLLSSVLFGNAKADQIVRAARDVLSKFGGKVPESAEGGLKEITGIGPKLAEILSAVNRRESYL